MTDEHLQKVLNRMRAVACDLRGHNVNKEQLVELKDMWSAVNEIVVVALGEEYYD